MSPRKQDQGDRPMDQWKVTELKDELKRRKLNTNGLKDDLVRRLSEAMEKEIDSTEENANQGFDAFKPNAEDEPADAVDEKSEVHIETGIAASPCEVQDGKTCVEPDHSAKEKMPIVQDSNLEKSPMGTVVDTGIKENDNSVPEENLVVQETNVETSLMGITIETKSIIENEMMPEIAVSEVPCDDVKLDSSEPSNQVSVVSPTLGFKVQSNSVSCDIINSTNEKNDKKDNIIADNVKLELDVKLPERGQPSSDRGSPHPMDVIEKPEIKISMKSDTGDLMSSEKLNLDRISVDESVEDDDAFESKQWDSVNSIAEAIVDDVDKPEASVMMGVDQETQTPVEEAIIEVPAQSAKRKPDQEGNSTVEGGKRQKRWNTNNNIPVEQRETTNPHGSSTVLKRNTISRTDSTVNEGAPKERIVPPSSKPPTNSLRIDRFLRPFTLKAVQELVGKTGKVTSFWMDHIKTHCYVTYSCVEEAIESRNAVYNLQWPQNGGKLLVAEFVDPQEVKLRVDAQTLPPAATPTSSRHRQVQQQPMIPRLPPPPPLANPPAPAKMVPHLPPPPPLAKPPAPAPAPAKMEQPLPPPPPPPSIEEKVVVEAPILTLDDIFRKTKATPRIYYLPLSDDQVAQKLRSLKQ